MIVHFSLSVDFCTIFVHLQVHILFTFCQPFLLYMASFCTSYGTYVLFCPFPPFALYLCGGLFRPSVPVQIVDVVIFLYQILYISSIFCFCNEKENFARHFSRSPTCYIRHLSLRRLRQHIFRLPFSGLVMVLENLYIICISMSWRIG